MYLKRHNGTTIISNGFKIYLWRYIQLFALNKSLELPVFKYFSQKSQCRKRGIFMSHMKLIIKGTFKSIYFYVNTLFDLLFSSNVPLRKAKLDLYKLIKWEVDFGQSWPSWKKKGLVKLYIKFKIRSKPLLFHYCIFKEQKFSHQSQIYLTGVQPWKCYIYHYY